MQKKCPLCGCWFTADQKWKKVCLACWLEQKRKDQTDRLQELEQEIIQLRGEVYALQFNQSEEFLRGNWRKLVSLIHPDKHGNSDIAKLITQELLELRQAGGWR